MGLYELSMVIVCAACWRCWWAGRAKVCGHELCSFPGCSEEKESETGAAGSEHQVPENNRYRSIDTVQTDDGRWARLAFFNIC